MGLKSLTSIFSVILGNRDLIVGFAFREIREKYVRSVAGMLWLVIYPACLLSIYVVVFGLVFKMRAQLSGPESGLGYTAYLITGYMAWLSAADCLNRAPLALSGNSVLVRQVVFALDVLPVKVVLVSLVPQAVLLLLSLPYLLAASGGTAANLLWLTLPYLLLLEFLLLCGLSWVLAAVGVFLADVKEIARLAVLVGPFLAPIFYTPEQLPTWLGWLIHLNPFTLLINCFRDALFFGRMEHPLSWIFAVPVCLGLFWAGGLLFGQMRPGFGDQV